MTDQTQIFHWLGVDLTVQSACASVFESTGFLLGQHSVSTAVANADNLHCVVTRIETGWSLDWHNGNRSTCETIAQVLVRLEYAWFMAIQNRHAGRMLFFHASAIGLDHHHCLIAGAPDSGKTTLAQTASSLGHHVIGDELIAVDISRWMMCGLQRGLKLNQSCLGALQLDDTTHLLPAAELVWAPQDWHRIDQLIILDPALSQPMQELQSAQAAQAIYPHCLNSLSFTNGGMQHIVGLTRSIQCACLGRSAPETMISLLQSSGAGRSG